MRLDQEALREAVNAHCRTLPIKTVTLTPRDCLVLGHTVFMAAEASTLRVVEYAGGLGVTTAVLVEALRQVEHPDAVLITCEIDSTRCERLRQLIGSAGVVLEGDIYAQPEAVIAEPIDLLVIDSAHVPLDTEWYIGNLWPAVRIGGYIWLHDMPDGDGDARLELEAVSIAARSLQWPILRRTGRKPGTQGKGVWAWNELPNTEKGTHNGAMVLRRPASAD
jgi:predicted O-methyltransferase YrrM